MPTKRGVQQDKWDRENTRQIRLKLNVRTDADILEFLDTVENKQGLIKWLIRNYIKAQEGE